MIPAEDILARLLCAPLTLDSVSAHEAGHAVMWRLVYPHRRGLYAIRGGMPAVVPADGRDLDLATATMQEAARHTLVKLAGYAGELLAYGWQDRVSDLAALIADDWMRHELGQSHRISWEEDEGGDIPCVMVIVKAQPTQWTLEVAAVNLERFLGGAVELLEQNRGKWLAERKKAREFFKGKI